MDKERFYDLTPFSSPICYKAFSQQVPSHATSGQYVLEGKNKIVRRVPNYVFNESGTATSHVLHVAKVFKEYGSFESLKVPDFDIVKGVFMSDDVRFDLHLLVVDQIDGENLYTKEFNEAEKSKARKDLEKFTLSFIDYANHKYDVGGSFPHDQHLGQYVYGKAPGEEEKSVYFVDLDPKLMKMDPFDYDNLDKSKFLGYLVMMIGRFIMILEEKTDGNFKNARTKYEKLLRRIEKMAGHSDPLIHYMRDELDKTNQ